MCDFSKGFKLCLCSDPRIIVHHRKSKRHQKKRAQEKKGIEYIWTLHRYVGKLSGDEMGRYIIPHSNIGNGLTAEFVLNELNNKDCFDFEYQASEGDNLIIATEEDMFYERLAFIYRDGFWVEDHYSPFEDDTKKITNGKLIENKE